MNPILNDETYLKNQHKPILNILDFNNFYFYYWKHVMLIDFIKSEFLSLDTQIIFINLLFNKHSSYSWDEVKFL